MTSVYPQVNWLKCARDYHGIDVDWLGLWCAKLQIVCGFRHILIFSNSHWWCGNRNERPWGTPDYVKELRSTMDAQGFAKTKLILGDGGMPPVLEYQNDTAFMSRCVQSAALEVNCCAPSDAKLFDSYAMGAPLPSVSALSVYTILALTLRCADPDLGCKVRGNYSRNTGL
eukprot:SAG31_NODE_1158_length_9605_cov_2.788555_14_plen_171_part_00